MQHNFGLFLKRLYNYLSNNKIPQLFNKFHDRVSTINHNLENDPELILIVDFCKLFAAVQSVSASRSTVIVMLQTATLVISRISLGLPEVV